MPPSGVDELGSGDGVGVGVPEAELDYWLDKDGGEIQRKSLRRLWWWKMSLIVQRKKYLSQ